MSWSDRFHPPIPVPGQRKPLETVLDAARYITGLPASEQAEEYWRPAATLLKLIGESGPGGGWMIGRIAVMHGLRKGAKDSPPEYNPDKPRDRPWGKRKLKRDR